MAVVRVFLDVNMGLGIPGLNELIKTHGVPQKENSSDMLMFVNSRRTQVKLLWSKKYLLHLRQETPIKIEDLKRIPAFFSGPILDGKIEGRVHKTLNEKTLIELDANGARVM